MKEQHLWAQANPDPDMASQWQEPGQAIILHMQPADGHDGLQQVQQDPYHTKELSSPPLPPSGKEGHSL